MKSWRQLIGAEMSAHGDTWEEVEAAVFDFSEVRIAQKWRVPDPDCTHTIPDETNVNECLDYRFNIGDGETEGPQFTLWTRNRVYFPVCYDGYEWAGSAPRNPCNEATAHHGGG